MVLQGLDVLAMENFKRLKGKNVALVVNYSFVDSKLRSGIDLMLKNEVNVVKIFTPEHGLYMLPDGKRYEMMRHPEYDIDIVSLYGEKFKPDLEDLEGVDVVVYDIQDAGLRFYTFIYTMAYVLETCAEVGVKFVVLDRMNPLGRRISGSRIPNELSSFVGGYSLPLRYGLTPGELALYFKKLKNLDVEVEVVKLEGWKGETFEKTDLVWNVPSPNLPTFESVLCYVGMCLIESTNLSEGRGTTKPFQFIGAPWMDSKFVYEELSKLKIGGFLFRRRDFVPNFSKYSGEVCRGIEFVPTSSDVDFLKIALEFLHVVSKNHGEFKVDGEKFARLIGDENALKMIEDGDIDGLLDGWKEDEKSFRDFIEDILIYPTRDVV